MIAKRQFKSEYDATRTTASTTRQIDKQRVISIDDAILLKQIAPYKTLACDGISRNNVREFSSSIKETVPQVRLRGLRPSLDSNTIMLARIPDSNAMTAQFPRFFQARASADICTVAFTKPMRAFPAVIYHLSKETYYGKR